uniref:Universal stress protein n=1 Tax=Desulfobacca acetoxidans TaxID=60893 RepID=A0A7C3Z850_9BACT
MKPTLFSSTRPCRLLVCTDGSPASKGASEAAFALARRWPCRIWVLQVLEYNPGFACQALDSIAQWEREARENLQAILSRVAESALSAEIVLRQGEAAPRAILAEAEQRQPDLIVMGRRGRGEVAGMLMGSVTARVIGLSPVNVLVVPRNAPLTFQRLLVAVDGSPCSEAAWQEALSLSKAWASYLAAVSVAPKEADIPETKRILEKLQDDADREGDPLDTLMLRGAPGEAVIRAAQTRGADLFILGSRGRTGLSRLFMGSVAEWVIGRARCPVLIVKRRYVSLRPEDGKL